MSLGLEAQDYFSSPRYGSGARASSPYSHAADVESVYEADVPGLVCRCVALPFSGFSYYFPINMSIHQIFMSELFTHKSFH